MRVLTFTSLFPSTARPRHGIFVETRLQQLVCDAGIDVRVIAPVPWFPFRSPHFGSYAHFAATPRRAVRDNGLQVSYPRYLMLPKLGVALQPDSMARAATVDVEALQTSGWRPDIIDAHYFYPDGVAAALLAQRMGVPLVVTARGTDVNVLGRTPGPARRILWAAQRCAAVIAVSTRLKESLLSLGVEAGKVTVIRNGVDANLFRPVERQSARQRLGLPGGRVIAACVGNLVPEKGFALAIEVLRELPDLHLVIVGDGPLRAALAALAHILHVHDRVTFLGTLPQPELATVYSSADVLLLTSTREGWPNVLLEAMACGIPVVAADVGAAAEMVTSHEVGRIVAAREAGAFAEAIRGLLAQGISPDLVRRHAVGFDWASVSAAQLEIFERVRAREAIRLPTASSSAVAL